MKNLSSWIKLLIATALVCLLGPFAINLHGYTPITLQSFAVITIPIIFGWKEGTAAIVLYLILGGFGLPVFADFKSGWEVFTGPTAGFLFGFIPVAAVSGLWANHVKLQYFQFFLLFLGCHVLLLLIGAIGLFIAGKNFTEIFEVTKYLLPGMFIKSFAGGIVALAVKSKAN